MVNAQYELLNYLKIEKLFSVVGGSMGGMQVLQFISNFQINLLLLFQLLAPQAILHKI